jgi:hypothetical protein
MCLGEMHKNISAATKIDIKSIGIFAPPFLIAWSLLQFGRNCQNTQSGTSVNPQNLNSLFQYLR